MHVSSRCGKPGLPPQATLWQITPERSRFDNKEKVIINCKKDEFPVHRQERECRNGRWKGPVARCGRHIDAQVVHMNIFDCESPNHILRSSQPLNQSEDGPVEYGPLRPNSFHNLRVPNDTVLSANGSKCYIWGLRLNRRVQIWFLLIDIWYANDNDSRVPTLTPIVSKYRTCRLAHNTTQVMAGDKVVGYYFYCDLNTESDAKSELNDLFDTISVHINTSVVKEIALEAIFIGDLFTTTIANKLVKPDCGQYDIKTIGVDLQSEQGVVYVSCNDSFLDLNHQNITLLSRASGNPKHTLRCNSNGQWVGDWPVCYPKAFCSTHEITDKKDSSVDVEEFGNVYHFNESHWFSMNNSFVKYKCVDENAILVGKDMRLCMKTGKWNHRAPYCTGTSISGLAISGILLAVLIVFVLIVVFVFRMHSKRVKRELRETRNEIHDSGRKRISDEFYADVKEDNYYYDNTEDMGRKSCAYETVGYEGVSEQPRYEPHTHNVRFNASEPEYLMMFSKH